MLQAPSAPRATQCWAGAMTVPVSTVAPVRRGGTGTS